MQEPPCRHLGDWHVLYSVLYKNIGDAHDTHNFWNPSVFVAPWLSHGMAGHWHGLVGCSAFWSWHTGHSESHALKPTNHQPLRLTTAFYWWIVPFSHFLILFHLHFQCPLVPLAFFPPCFATRGLPLKPEDYGNGSYSGWCTSLHWRVSTITWLYLNLQVLFCAHGNLP